jgi:hypothetical protein
MKEVICIMDSPYSLSSLSTTVLQELAPMQTIKNLLVAGLHRASPSTSLDKSSFLFDFE